jgi:hypothetical protein
MAPKDALRHTEALTPVWAAVAFAQALVFGAPSRCRYTWDSSRWHIYFRRACQSVSWHSVSSSAMP